MRYGGDDDIRKTTPNEGGRKLNETIEKKQHTMSFKPSCLFSLEV